MKTLCVLQISFCRLGRESAWGSYIPSLSKLFSLNPIFQNIVKTISECPEGTPLPKKKGQINTLHLGDELDTSQAIIASTNYFLNSSWLNYNVSFIWIYTHRFLSSVSGLFRSWWYLHSDKLCRPGLELYFSPLR